MLRPRAGDGTSIFLALWEYEVKPGCEERFEKVYGPAGEWAVLFRCDSNYQETCLLRDSFRPAIYLTLDFWKSRQAHEEFLAAHRAEYKKLDALAEGLTINERRVGDYESIAP